jgi:hypothetical protein
MADERPNTRPALGLEVEGDDFNSMLREQMGDVIKADAAVADAPERAVEDLDRKEPEVVVERDPVATDGGQRDATSRPGQPSEDVTRALSTISRLESELSDLRSRVPAREAVRREPSLEFEEVVPGVTLPKDRNAWPVQLTPELVKAAGLDPEVAPGLNILANAFLLHINNLLTPTILGQVRNDAASRETVNARMAGFYNEFPDLRQQGDLLEIVESRSRDTERLHEKYAGEDYMREIGKRTRARIAALRGQTPEQYELGLKTNAAAPREPSRATTTPVRRTARQPATSDQQREIDDAMIRS